MTARRVDLERRVAAAEARLLLAQGHPDLVGHHRDAVIARRTGKLNVARQELAAWHAAHPRQAGTIYTPAHRRDLDGPVTDPGERQ